MAEYISEGFKGLGFEADLYEVRHAKEYANILLHFNPRLILDTLSGRLVEIEVTPSFKPEGYDAFVFSSPIWYERVVPAMRAFLARYRGRILRPVACYTTSTLRRNYAPSFKTLLETLGYSVITCTSIYNPDKDRDAIERLVRGIGGFLKASLLGT